MRKMFCAILLTAGVLCAQKEEKPPALPPGFTFKVYTLKYVRPDTLQRLLSAFGVNVQRSDNAVAVSGPSEAMKAVDEAVKVLDTAAAAQPPHKSIQLTGYMILASAKPGDSGVPADLESVVKQLRASFPYQGYRMLDSFVLRAADNARGTMINGFVPSPDARAENSSIRYQFQVGSAEMGSDGAVRLSNLELQLSLPTQGKPVNIVSSLDIKEGQKVVVGKSNLGSPDSAFFLVLTAKILE